MLAGVLIRRVAMNSSLVDADVRTHLKIVAVALLAAGAVIWVGLGTRLPF
jgi:hypothetical protein